MIAGLPLLHCARCWFLRGYCMETTSTAVVLYQFVRNCAQLAAQLDSVGSRDGRVMIATALIVGQKRYKSLLTELDELPETVAHAPLVRVLLDNLQARLKFLEMRT
jgi:hypothetical protein